MYTSAHSAVGAAIMISGTAMLESAVVPTTIAFAACGSIAFLSHHFVDYVGEFGIPLKKALPREAVFFFLIIFFTYIFGWEVFIGAILGNLMDIIDKTLNWGLKRHQIFPCHRPGATILYKIKSERQQIIITAAIYFLLISILFLK